MSRGIVNLIHIYSYRERPEIKRAPGYYPETPACSSPYELAKINF
jgi:hypothetical protein